MGTDYSAPAALLPPSAPQKVDAPAAWQLPLTPHRERILGRALDRVPGAATQTKRLAQRRVAAVKNLAYAQRELAWIDERLAVLAAAEAAGVAPPPAPPADFSKPTPAFP
ncbi:hypothetical protein [Hymenobacter nivis]|uniref:Uncharacterized protein n=1 Tax=Hymenobacter nivis TaxID=1850093 RepID=A0A502GWX6_9BACT|nr:hypothetical protein [Hymenobacter nivis]TPG66055.1 hypothetical protein EAH73_11845 [Hymenobacter nivis]